MKLCSVSAIMSWKRSALSCRLRTRIAIFAFLLLLISVSLTYRALNNQDSSDSGSYSSFPTLDRKRPVRFRPKHQELDISKLVHDELGRPHPKGNGDVHNPKLNLVEPDFLLKGSESLKDRDLLSANSKEAVTNFLKRLYPTNWAETPEADDMALELKYLLLDYGFESKLSCKEIDNLKLGNPVSYAKAKFVEYAFTSSKENSNSGYNDNYYNYNSRGNDGYQTKSNLAVKSPSHDLDTKIICMKQIYDPEFCGAMSNYRLLRELLLMATMHHPCIPQLKGYCLRGDRISSRLQQKGLVFVTEVGKPLTMQVIYGATYAQRISMALQIAHLLVFLDSSPVGSLRFQKIQMKDFILVNGHTVKLADLDDLVMGEKTCRSNSDCQIEEKGQVAECTQGLCKGFNSVSNLYRVSKEVVLPLLQVGRDDSFLKLAEKLRGLELSTSELVSELQKLYKTLPKGEESAIVGRQSPNVAAPWPKPINRQSDGRNWEENSAKVGETVQTGDEVVSRYERHDMKNYIGIYDYPCPGSRVTWGCVHTVGTLKEAAILCANDEACKSFVTFTTRPEVNGLMTVVLKNGSDPNPQTSSGTTLFIRKDPSLAFEKERRESEEEDLPDTGGESPSIETEECIDRTKQVYESALYSREKRLMAHLGLKGYREQQWRLSVLKQDIGRILRITRIEGGGGRFVTELIPRGNEDEVAQKAMFVSEEGPKAYHMAYAVVYHLDRLLGLYHTPPSVGKKLSATEVDQLHGNPTWEESFRPLIESDGTLMGLMVVPTPKIMKVSKLTITYLQTMTTEVTAFERPEKLQLEYILLWWLGQMSKRSSDHLGYKGHFIHFTADKSLLDGSDDLKGYLNHCQFPNVAYKALQCFRCTLENGTSKICSLGQEAFRKALSMFPDETEIAVGTQRESYYTARINRSATSILRVVDKCIKEFGREKVLY